MSTVSRLRMYGLWLAGCAAIVLLYVWYTSPNAVPDAYKGTAADPFLFYTSDQLRESATLNAIRNGIFFFSWPWQWAIYLFLLTGGWSRAWKERIEAGRLPAFVRLPLYVLLVYAVSVLLYLPLKIASYAVSRGYGISTQTAGSWLEDRGLDFVIGYITALAVFAVARWVMSRGGRWWLRLWLISVPFTLFMMYVEPVVIDPLYNKFEELSDPTLESAILDLAGKADIPADRVYEVRMSDKTNAINAYVSGIGSSLRIVLWDTALTKLERPEIMQIMAHEMGHYVKHHLEWSAIGAIGSSFALLWIGGAVYKIVVRTRGREWGISRITDMNALPLILLLLSVLNFVSLPVSNAVSRQAEADADRYALELLGTADGAVSMHQKLAVAALSDVNPPLLVKWLRSTHPSDMARIVQAERYAEQHGETTP
ncbi:M48 family metallopeptidase [Cohnella hashimotonis]|uniref:M48 family metallopeptidase n=1 Tax=Cohnella hashimotonis TaxID=2826895 RepID=A0ABT6TJS7_9BACL|nr:M48 family metallopeptidase [Cohnella hashimotonis]MDI4646816.1 M48 family metallopeptidase [Cohnella hashimotonis]